MDESQADGTTCVAQPYRDAEPVTIYVENDNDEHDENGEEDDDNQRVYWPGASDPLHSLDELGVQRFVTLYTMLRPYQRELLQSCFVRDSIICLPTGAGKTLTSITLAARHLLLYPQHIVLFVVNRRPLLTQQSQALRQHLGCEVAEVMGKAKAFNTVDKLLAARHCRVVTIIDSILLSWCLRWPNFLREHVSLIIFDEVHHATGGKYKELFAFIHTHHRRPLYNTNAEGRLLEQALQHNSHANATASALSLETETSMLLQPLPYLRLPQLLGLTASPIKKFKEMHNEVVALHATTRCALLQTQKEVGSLACEVPTARMACISYWPCAEEVLLRRTVLEMMRLLHGQMGAVGTLLNLDVQPVVNITFQDMCMNVELQLRSVLGRASMLAHPSFSSSSSQLQSAGSATQLAMFQTNTAPTTAAQANALREVSHNPTQLRLLIECVSLLRSLSVFIATVTSVSITAAFNQLLRDYNEARFVQLVEMSASTPALLHVVLPLLAQLFELARICAARGLYKTDAKTTATPTTPEPPSEAKHAESEPSTQEGPVKPQPFLTAHSFSSRLQLLLRVIEEFATLADDTIATRSDHPSAANEGEGALDDQAACFRCIVFTDTKMVASIIYDYLCRSGNGRLRAGLLMGQNKSTNSRGMTQAQQSDVLARFRSGAVRFLIATSVAEEGLDVQSCNVVIRYHHCPTLVSVIQSRGRARQARSLFVIFADRLSGESALRDICRRIETNQSILANTPQVTNNAAATTASGGGGGGLPTPQFTLANVPSNAKRDNNNNNKNNGSSGGNNVYEEMEDDYDDYNNIDGTLAESELGMNELWLRLPESVLLWVQRVYAVRVCSVRAFRTGVDGTPMMYYAFMAAMPVLSRHTNEEEEKENKENYVAGAGHNGHVLVTGDYTGARKQARRCAMQRFCLKAAQLGYLAPVQRFYRKEDEASKAMQKNHAKGLATIVTQTNEEEEADANTTTELSPLFDHVTYPQPARGTYTDNKMLAPSNNNLTNSTASANDKSDEDEVGLQAECDPDNTIDDLHTLLPPALLCGRMLCVCRDATLRGIILRRLIPTATLVRRYEPEDWAGTQGPHNILLHELRSRRLPRMSITQGTRADGTQTVTMRVHLTMRPHQVLDNSSVEVYCEGDYALENSCLKALRKFDVTVLRGVTVAGFVDALNAYAAKLEAVQ